MSDLRLVTRGEREPAAAGCSGASELGPGCTFCLAMDWGFFCCCFAFPLLSGLVFFFFVQGLQNRLEHLLVAALKAPCAEPLGCPGALGWVQLCHVDGQHSAGTPQ